MAPVARIEDGRLLRPVPVKLKLASGVTSPSTPPKVTVPPTGEIVKVLPPLIFEVLPLKLIAAPVLDRVTLSVSIIGPVYV